MHEYSVLTRDAILEYLGDEFPAYTIHEETQEDSYCFKLEGDSRAYFLRVMFSAVASDDEKSIAMLLTQYAAADTMRGLGDFPVVVTDQGCMFGSP